MINTGQALIFNMSSIHVPQLARLDRHIRAANRVLVSVATALLCVYGLMIGQGKDYGPEFIPSSPYQFTYDGPYRFADNSDQSYFGDNYHTPGYHAPYANHGLHINRTGLELIKHFEGFRATRYRDKAGHWTIGYGHKIRPGENFTTITEKQAEALLIKDIKYAEGAVKRLVEVPLSPNQYAALVSFVYNLGEGNFANSTLLARLNEGDYHSVPVEMKRWNKVNKRTSAGLKRRRSAEVKLFVASL